MLKTIEGDYLIFHIPWSDPFSAAMDRFDEFIEREVERDRRRCAPMEPRDAGVPGLGAGPLVWVALLGIVEGFLISRWIG